MSKVTFKGEIEINVEGSFISKGVKAPNFTLVKADLSNISLDGLKGKKVLLNIFPSLDTGVCAASVRKFNEMAANMDNTVVLSVSKDLPFAMGRFCSAEGIENVVSASGFRDADFGKEYGVFMLDGPLAGLYARSVVVIGEDGIVKYTELVPEITQEPDYDAALSNLK